MAKFPQFAPETLAQAIRTRLAAKMNVPALQNGGSPDYNAVIDAWSEAIGDVQNPANAYFDDTTIAINAEIQQLQSEKGTAGTLLFTAAQSMSIGQFVYQVSTDTVDLADYSTVATGPAIGVVVGLPTQTTVTVQNFGSFSYTLGMGFPFLPLVADTIYYVGAAGNITTTPNAPTGGYNQEIGYAKNSLQFVLNIQEPILV